MMNQCCHHILVVDDDDDIREVLGEVLRDAGHQVKTASNGAEALDILKDGGAHPCLVLLDLMMPVMDGYRFLEHKRQDPALAGIPTAVITAGRTVEFGRLTGAQLLPKPIQLPTLLKVVAEFC